MGASLWAWIHSFHVQLSDLSTSANPVSSFAWLLASPCSQPPTAVTVGWQHLLDLSFGEPSFTFGGQKSLVAVTFLVY